LVRHVRVRGKDGRRVRPGLALVIALLPVASGCSLLGGLSGQGLKTAQAMIVTSPVFSSDLAIPPQYTCEGAGLSPPLLWSGAPQGGATKSFAIVVDDSQAPISPYVYWIVFDISPTTTAVPQNQLPPHARVGLNSRGMARYDPPCPAAPSHQYRFTVYALNARLRLPNGAGLRETWSAIARHVIGIGRLTALARQ
jgi:Raf kinase inhibitor-like YbhB/YbcL family protein